MKIEKFNKLKSKLETFAFENNFYPLAITLYLFSFLGNIFLVLFSYFFIKDVTDTIPKLFEYQNQFFAVFILLFMIGYELFKRFSFEQLAMSILRVKRFTIQVFVGTAVCLGLVTGSFYLSLNGAHRLIDTTETVVSKNDDVIKTQTDSINAYYGGLIKSNQGQIQNIYTNNKDGLLLSREKSSLEKFEKNIKELDSVRNTAISAIEIKYASKPNTQLEKVKQNDVAFAFMVFFLELIILIGVGFHAYYTWTSYDNMSRLLKTTKFQELETYLKLLAVIYENGKNRKDDLLPSFDKLHSVCELQGIDIDNTDLNKFVTLCTNFNILLKRNDKHTFEVDFEESKRIFEGQFYI